MTAGTTPGGGVQMWERRNERRDVSRVPSNALEDEIRAHTQKRENIVQSNFLKRDGSVFRIAKSTKCKRGCEAWSASFHSNSGRRWMGVK